MTTPNLPDFEARGADSMRKLGRLRDMLPPSARFDMLRGMLVQLRDNFYADMHILQRVDGSLIITVTPPPGRE